MREIKINGKIYVIKFTHKAAKCQKCVQKMFEIITGAYIVKGSTDGNELTLADMISGMTAQTAEIPSLCDTLMYAGLKAENPVETEEEAGDLLIEYMEETGKDYAEIFESFKECMTEDGFFKIAGIEAMAKTMGESMNEAIPAENKPAKAKTAKTTTKKTTSQSK